MAKTFSESYYGKAFEKKTVNKRGTAEQGENRAALDFSLEGMLLEPIDVADVQQVVDRCSLYFRRCSEEGLRPGVAAMCVWLGIPRQRWQGWCSGAEYRGSHYAVCNKINGIFEAQMEAYVQTGKINPVSGIFLMKNNYGYTDETPTPKDGKESAVEEVSMKEILQLAAGKKKKK